MPDKELLGQEGGRMAVFGLVQTFFFFPSSVRSLHPSLTFPSGNSRKGWYLMGFKYLMIKKNAYPILNKKLVNQCFPLVKKTAEAELRKKKSKKLWNHLLFLFIPDSKRSDSHQFNSCLEKVFSLTLASSVSQYPHFFLELGKTLQVGKNICKLKQNFTVVSAKENWFSPPLLELSD